MENDFKILEEKYPFLTIIKYANKEHIGIVMNQDREFTTMYDLTQIDDLEEKRKFLSFGEIWWWESNRNIPINLFLKEEWVIFKKYRTTFNNKNSQIITGPCTNLNDLAKKRSKRKSITLIKDVD